MRGHIILTLTDGTFESFGPYDATDAARFLAVSRMWARAHCRGGRVKAEFIYLAGEPVACYRSRPNGGYQVARGFRQRGALLMPNWRG